MKTLYKKIGIGGLFVVGLIALYASGLISLITFENLRLQREVLRLFTASHYSLAVCAYIIFYIVVVTFSLPVALVVTLAGGFLFGAFWGAIYTNIGATTGALLAFLLIRYVIGDYFQQRYRAQLHTFNHEIQTQGATYLLVVHLIPVIPFFLITILAACTPISIGTFFWTTALGIFPGSLVYTYAGSQLMQIEMPGDIFSPPLIIAFCFLIVLALLPLFVNKMKTRKR